jgi:predicted methyltransferase
MLFKTAKQVQMLCKKNQKKPTRRKDGIRAHRSLTVKPLTEENRNPEQNQHSIIYGANQEIETKNWLPD